MIGVMLVEDDPLTLELHRALVERVDGFRVTAECTSAREAVTALRDPAVMARVDLALVDVTLPDGSGLDLVRGLRATGARVDVFAVTAVHDADTVRRMAALGVAHYLVKPFTAGDLRARLEQYRAYHRQATDTGSLPTQHEIDALFGALRPVSRTSTPKGLSQETLDLVARTLRAADGLSAAETGTRLGLSRVVARRYLEHLVGVGAAERAARYGTPGRPVSEYRWRS